MWKASVMLNQNVRDLPNQNEDNSTEFVGDQPNQGETSRSEPVVTLHHFAGQD